MKRARVALPRVVIGYPVGGSATIPFVTSLNKLMQHEFAIPEQERMITRIIPASGLYVSKNRNKITRQFLDGGNEEWLLMIDTDIEFQPDLPARLVLAAMKYGAKILAANVRLGSHTHSGYARSEWLWTPMAELPSGECFPVDAAATAVMLIHRDVFLAIKEKGGKCWFNHLYLEHGEDGDIEEIGEDLAFCERAASVGVQTWLLRGLGIKHHKTRALVEDYVAEANEQLKGVA